MFGRSRGECEALKVAGHAYRVLPGVSSTLAAPLLAGIPLTDPASGASSFAVFSGADTKGQLASGKWDNVNAAADTLIFLMAVCCEITRTVCVFPLLLFEKLEVATVYEDTAPAFILSICFLGARPRTLLVRLNLIGFSLRRHMPSADCKWQISNRTSRADSPRWPRPRGCRNSGNLLECDCSYSNR